MLVGKYGKVVDRVESSEYCFVTGVLCAQEVDRVLVRNFGLSEVVDKYQFGWTIENVWEYLHR